LASLGLVPFRDKIARPIARALFGDPIWNVDMRALKIAGTAIASPQTDINKSWASGFGVRLLDRLVADYYEK